MAKERGSKREKREKERGEWSDVCEKMKTKRANDTRTAPDRRFLFSCYRREKRDRVGGGERGSRPHRCVSVSCRGNQSGPIRCGCTTLMMVVVVVYVCMGEFPHLRGIFLRTGTFFRLCIRYSAAVKSVKDPAWWAVPRETGTMYRRVAIPRPTWQQATPIKAWTPSRMWGGKGRPREYKKRAETAVKVVVA